MGRSPASNVPANGGHLAPAVAAERARVCIDGRRLTAQGRRRKRRRQPQGGRCEASSSDFWVSTSAEVRARRLRWPCSSAATTASRWSRCFRGRRSPLYDGPLLEMLAPAPTRRSAVCRCAAHAAPCLRCQGDLPGTGGCVDPAVVQMRRLAASRPSPRGSPPGQTDADPVHAAADRDLPAAQAGGGHPRDAGPGHGPVDRAGLAPAPRAGRSLPPGRQPDRGATPRARCSCCLGQPYKKRPDARLRSWSGCPD